MSDSNDKPEQESCGCGCGCGGGGMSGKAWLITAGIIVILLVIAIWSQAETNPPAATSVTPAIAEKPVALPRLVDLGADKCIPCKKMAPLLEELKKEYQGRLTVEFIDVWKNPEAGKKYGIELIPTQILYGPDGKELFRHEGFFGKEEILAKWKELGIELGATPLTKNAK